MKKQQLHEALAVLLTKLSSARDNPLLIDNYSVKALRTTLVTFKESGELHKALKEQIQTAMKSNNPWINILRKSMNIDSSIDEHITDEKHLCLYVKDVIDDVDGYDGIVFNRWYADMCRKGVQVDWYECR